MTAVITDFMSQRFQVDCPPGYDILHIHLHFINSEKVGEFPRLFGNGAIGLVMDSMDLRWEISPVGWKKKHAMWKGWKAAAF